MLVGSLLLGEQGAFAQSAGPASSSLWAPLVLTVSNNKPTPIVFTGAIGDYGSTVTVNSSGKADGHGKFDQVTLKKGRFTLDTSSLSTAFSNSAGPSDFNTQNCSGSYTVGPVTISVVAGSGTGAYKGVSGSFTVTATLAAVLPSKKGTCNQSGTPVGGFGSITGPGTVSFAS
ncbi:MAG TPA: hypothetical protein VNV87_19560 [Acidimicrobiales bacterium]|nr:hypothetical protein [Acidimicrobiales bacterium]